MFTSGFFNHFFQFQNLNLNLGQNVTRITDSLNFRLSSYSPLHLIVITSIGIFSLQKFVNSLQPRWGETWREKLGRLSLKNSFLKKEYNKDIQSHLYNFCLKTQKNWEKFGPMIVQIPEKGWTNEQVFARLENFVKITQESVKDKYFSGTIYSKSLITELQKEIGFQKTYKEVPDTSDPFIHLSLRLKKIFTNVFKESYLWNSLHANEFGIGAFVDYQVVRMVADLFGGKLEDVMGFVTTGGTESLMLAARSYREWGMKTRGHAPGESVIIAGKSIHAAIHKAALAYNIKVVLAKTDEAGVIDIEELNKLAQQYGDKVVAIFGSTPSYAKGKIDPIEILAATAKKLGCGMHVDSCLGGFLLNHCESGNSEFLKIPGVTSISIDTHKNGWAPKGSSVLVTKALGDRNLAYYSIYSLPDWDGGVYGTAKDPGSEPCFKSLATFFGMLAIGKEGYRLIGEAILSTTKELEKRILKFKGKLKLLGVSDLNVVAFKIDKNWGLNEGSSYVFAHSMSKRGFVLNDLKGDAVHFCVTGRCIGDEQFLDSFEWAIEESLKEIEKMNSDSKRTGAKLPGNASIYCALDSAIEPDRQKIGTAKYLRNMVLGVLGARDSVKAYFLASLDPYQIKNSLDETSVA